MPSIFLTDTVDLTYTVLMSIVKEHQDRDATFEKLAIGMKQPIPRRFV